MITSACSKAWKDSAGSWTLRTAMNARETAGGHPRWPLPVGSEALSQRRRSRTATAARRTRSGPPRGRDGKRRLRPLDERPTSRAMRPARLLVGRHLDELEPLAARAEDAAACELRRKMSLAERVRRGLQTKPSTWGRAPRRSSRAPRKTASRPSTSDGRPTTLGRRIRARPSRKRFTLARNPRARRRRRRAGRRDILLGSSTKGISSDPGSSDSVRALEAKRCEAEPSGSGRARPVPRG